MKLDVLAIAAHPDDVELSCGGTIALLAKQGKSVGIIDVTRGELGTRGTPAIRAQEAMKAAKILGVKVRENLNRPDGNIDLSRENILRLITALRTYQPAVLLIPHSSERHPDHEHTYRLAKEAWYYSGLAKIKTKHRGRIQGRHRPGYYLEYLMLHPFTPSFIVDISETYDTKIAAIKSFASQFHDPERREKETLLSRPHFLDFIETRAKYYGQLIGAKYGEAFYSAKTLGVTDVFSLKFFSG